MIDVALAAAFLRVVVIEAGSVRPKLVSGAQARALSLSKGRNPSCDRGRSPLAPDPVEIAAEQAWCHANPAHTNPLQWKSTGYHWAYAFCFARPSCSRHRARQGRLAGQRRSRPRLRRHGDSARMLIIDWYLSAIGQLHGFDATLALENHMKATMWGLAGFMIAGMAGLLLGLPLAIAAQERAGRMTWWAFAAGDRCLLHLLRRDVDVVGFRSGGGVPRRGGVRHRHGDEEPGDSHALIITKARWAVRVILTAHQASIACAFANSHLRSGRLSRDAHLPVALGDCRSRKRRRRPLTGSCCPNFISRLICGRLRCRGTCGWAPPSLLNSHLFNRAT